MMWGGVGWGIVTFASTCVTKLMFVDVGWGGVGHVNVSLHLRREVDASCLMWSGVGWGGVGHVNVR